MTAKLTETHDRLSLKVTIDSNTFTLSLGRTRASVTGKGPDMNDRSIKSISNWFLPMLDVKGQGSYGETFKRLEVFGNECTTIAQFCAGPLRLATRKAEVEAKTTASRASAKYEYPEGMSAKDKQAFRAKMRKAAKS